MERTQCGRQRRGAGLRREIFPRHVFAMQPLPRQGRGGCVSAAPCMPECCDRVAKVLPGLSLHGSFEVRESARVRGNKYRQQKQLTP